MKSAAPRERLAFALDVATAAEAEAWVDRLLPWVGIFKVGLRLFTAEGPGLIRRLSGADRQIFLDLKFHDIPATVATAVEAAVQLGVDYLTVHASGGPRMLAAAAEVLAKQPGRRPRALAVTVLTSHGPGEVAALGWGADPRAQVLRLSDLAVDAGMDGIVASPEELDAVVPRLGDRLCVTPGIRPVAAADDQTRTATPEDAIARGASILVVGRPIRSAPNPEAAAQAILAAMQKGMAS